MLVSFESFLDVANFVSKTNKETLKGLFNSPFLSTEEKLLIREAIKASRQTIFTLKEFNDGNNVFEVTLYLNADNLSESEIVRSGFGSSTITLADLDENYSYYDQVQESLKSWIDNSINLKALKDITIMHLLD